MILMDRNFWSKVFNIIWTDRSIWMNQDDGRTTVTDGQTDLDWTAVTKLSNTFLNKYFPKTSDESVVKTHTVDIGLRPMFLKFGRPRFAHTVEKPIRSKI